MNTDQPIDAWAFDATKPEGSKPEPEVFIPWYMQSQQDHRFEINHNSQYLKEHGKLPETASYYGIPTK